MLQLKKEWMKVAVGAFFAAVAPALAQGVLPDWSSVTVSPFTATPPPGITNPVVTPEMVTEFDAAIVADPFLFYERDTFYLFMEVSPDPAVICLAKSTDGFHYRYDRVVLRETHHLSYPQVFKYDGSYYMLPETKQGGAVKLYKAKRFPYEWELHARLVEGSIYADPTIVRYENTWYFFAGINGSSSRTCVLYYSDSLASGWRVHPRSPIVDGDMSSSRPAGRILQIGGRMYRLAQICEPSYGTGVRVFRIKKLSKTEYEDTLEIPALLYASGSGWNGKGMHQFDPVWTGRQWVCMVDGVAMNGWLWTIGVLATDPVTAVRSPVLVQVDGRSDGGHVGMEFPWRVDLCGRLVGSSERAAVVPGWGSENSAWTVRREGPRPERRR